MMPGANNVAFGRDFAESYGGVCATNDALTIIRVITQVRAKGSRVIAWYVFVMGLPVFNR